MEIENGVAPTGATKETSFERAKNMIRAGYGVEPILIADNCQAPAGIVVAATRAPRIVVMDSPELQEQLVAASKTAFKSLKVFPSRPALPWQLGVASVKGNVRSQNEDVGVTFGIGDFDVLIVADGCGGIPHGREAAYLAAASAGIRLIQILGTPPRWGFPNVEDAIRSAIWSAHHQLALQADDFGIACGDINGGLRTTLIIAVGCRDQLHYGYVGDGGGWLVRSNGKVDRFLAPQKSPDVLNVLEASLGPLMAGNPVIGTLERETGDLALIGTDGVFDRIPAKEIEVFGKDVLRACIQCDGELQNVAIQVCAEYAELKDTAGYICDDNLTLGLLGTRTKPVLGPGFWDELPTIPEACSASKEGKTNEKEITENRDSRDATFAG